MTCLTVLVAFVGCHPSSERKQIRIIFTGVWTMPPSFGWTDIEEIGFQLAENYPDENPRTVAFPRLRELVEQLDGFENDESRRVNEQILEAVQAAWIEETEEDVGVDEEDSDESGYTPMNPFR